MSSKRRHRLATDRDILEGYLDDCRDLIVDEIRDLVPRDERPGSLLYELMQIGRAHV